jgi:hypothetical protein
MLAEFIHSHSIFYFDKTSIHVSEGGYQFSIASKCIKTQMVQVLYLFLKILTHFCRIFNHVLGNNSEVQNLTHKWYGIRRQKINVMPRCTRI